MVRSRRAGAQQRQRAQRRCAVETRPILCTSIADAILGGLAVRGTRTAAVRAGRGWALPSAGHTRVTCPILGALCRVPGRRRAPRGVWASRVMRERRVIHVTRPSLGTRQRTPSPAAVCARRPGLEEGLCVARRLDMT